MHHLLHGGCVLLAIAARVTIASLLLRHHHWVVVRVLVVEQVVEQRRVRVRSHRHASTAFVARVDVGHIRAKLSQGGGPLMNFGLLLFRTIVAEHVRELGSFVWNSALQTIARPYLEFFVIAEQSFIGDGNFDQGIVCDRLEPRYVERCCSFLHLWGLHQAFIARSYKLLRLF